MPLKCKVCESDSHQFAVAKVLCKYEVDYFKCSNCGFVQTEEPYWLEEAYSQPIASSDVGLAFRNLSFSQITQKLLFNFFNHQARFLDYGGGYGLFVRLMRDAGFDFYWLDKFCQNIFAQGFEIDAAANNQFELVTAFEVFEHLVHPINDLEELLKISRNILLSTELLPESNPKPDEWWYYVLHEGQHVSLYTTKSLSILAAKFNLNLYSNGSSLHLLTEKELPDDLFQQLAKRGLAAVNKVSLLQNDFLKAVSKITNIQQEAKIQPAEIEEEGDSQSALTILVDGVFFQMYRTGIARVWRSLLEEWAENGFAKHIIVLDRVGTSPKVPGIRYCTVPAYDYSKTDADREMLQQVCDETGADLFISTYYTTPLSTPSVFMAYDMIPEVVGANLNEPMWKEKHHAIRHASAYITISENTAKDLTKFFPEVASKSVTVAQCGVQSLFSPASQEDINGFKNKYGISKPYFISVGGGSDYKNTILFFQAFGKLASKQGFEIVFTGSGILLEGELRIYTAGSVVHKLQLSDEELRLAYSGAVALIYPSLYEGFGLPVLEAMACGCPVITCPNASIPEVAGAAALYVKDDDIDGLTDTLCEVQKPKIRNSLIAAGLEQAKNFSWSQMAQTVSSALINATKLTLKETDEQTPQQLDKRKAIEELLVEMRNKPAYQLPLQYDLPAIPQQLLNEYIRLLFELPYLFQNIGEVNMYYQYIQRWVDYIHTNIFQHSESNFWHSVALLFKRYAKFALYFSNNNLKEIYVKRADIMEFALKIQGHQIDFDLPERSADRDKIRLGILADNFSTQAEIFATLPVYKHLNRDEFEIILYFINASGHRFEKCCLGYTDVAVKLPQNLNVQVETIRKWELDILFIANNITAQTNTISELALHRLAPIQVVGMNSPVTTGMRHIDYYISSKLTETEIENDTQNHYRENLVKLDVPAQCFDFATEEQLIKTISFQRETTGIPQNAVVYISGANFFKILPEVEETWIKIIAGVPDAVLVLYPFNPNWAPIYPVTAFKQRLVATLAKYGLDADRLILLDAVPNRTDVKERLKVADIYLDSYPYAGMTSLIDPLEIGLPTVVMSGNYARSNMGASLLRELQMPDLIADSEESYIDLAIALGTNPDFRQQKSTYIKQKMQANPAFIDSRSYSNKIGSLLKEIFYKHQVNALRDKLNLREINLIIFPDWSQPEELLLEELAVVIKATAIHSDKSKMTLLIDTSKVSDHDANLALSSVAMNLLMEEELDVSDGPEISLIGQLSNIQWKALIPRLQGRIVLEHENIEAIAHAKAENIPSLELDRFMKESY